MEQLWVPGKGFLEEAKAEKLLKPKIICPHYQNANGLCVKRMHNHKAKRIHGTRDAYFWKRVKVSRDHSCLGDPSNPEECLIFQGERI